MELDPEFLELVKRLETGLKDFARAATGVAEALTHQINALFNALYPYSKSRGRESLENFIARMDKKERSRRRYYRIMKRKQRH